MANKLIQLQSADGLDNLFPNIVGGAKIDLLWTNPNPTSNFSAQTLSLNSAGYDMLMITAKNVTGGSIYVNSLIYKGMTETQYIMSHTGTGTCYRKTYDVTDSSISFDTGYIGSTANAGNALPYKIFGIKVSYSIPTEVQGIQYIEV